mmetsp:Transcript_101227/g.179801  ORF Transcript_101227/g.179801 Transcript_101227/m.179801 type:complete len:1288 (-) Transcript_101227:141-4004(-)
MHPASGTGLDSARLGRPSFHFRPVRRSHTEASSRSTADVPADLLELQDFNDEELLRGLWARYEKREIFTWVGSVLVSVNPYSDVGVFKEEMANRYAANPPPKAPHLYATVRHALSAPGSRHAILISGESGAGKTEATRAILSFLAMRHTSTDYIRDRLLRSTPVLEAFGNAHTRQNSNSSRFGKFIEVHLAADGEVVGATLQPYMLEASRVAGDLPQGERTYHVFYLLRAALVALASPEVPASPFWARLAEQKDWAELVQTAAKLLGSSERLAHGPTQEACLEWFQGLVEGLLATGMRHLEVAECCRIVAAVSLLSDTQLGEEALQSAAILLRIEEKEIRAFLARVEMSVGSERVHRERSKAEATTLRASLSQELYAALFAWLTRLVARGIAPRKAEGGRMLGLLDLYGFEVFPTNGFEQFLINYCNERLQQFFNRQVFLREAEEYHDEGLSCGQQWTSLKTACQLPALALLEGQGAVGIFGVINDRSKCNFEETLSGASCGTALTETISGACGGHAAFRKASGRDASRLFGVKHFAGEVYYEAAHFVRKNASAHRPDIVSFLREHGGSFVREVLAGEAEELPEEKPSNGRRGRKLFGRTLITIFQQELNELCQTLEARQCRHVRCLRPNDEQKPLVFDDDSMLRQCRYSGLLEATRIRKQGFAHRRPLAAFADRYALLLPSAEARKSARSMEAEESMSVCKDLAKVAESAGVSRDDLQIGITKVFLRSDALQLLDTMRVHVASAVVAAALLAYRARQRFLRKRAAAVSVQAFARGCAGRRAAIMERQLLAARLAAAAAERAAQAAAQHAAAERAAREQETSRAALKVQHFWRKRQAAACWQRERQLQALEVMPAEIKAREEREPTQIHPSMQLPVAALAHGPVEEDVAKAMKSPTALLRHTTPSNRHVGEVQIGGRNTLSISTRPLQAHELLDMSCSSVQAYLRDETAPQALHQQCVQDCMLLLLQHQKLSHQLPRDHQLALAELSQTSEFLSANPASKIEEHLVSVRDRISHIKACLRVPVPVPVAAGAEPVTTPRHTSVRVASPVVLDGVSTRPEMLRSASAFSVVRTVPHQSPRTGFRSPLRTGTGSTRSSSLQRGSVGVQTPVRATVGTPKVSAPVVATPVAQRASISFIPAAMVVAAPPATVMPATVPQWAWQPAVAAPAPPVVRAEKMNATPSKIPAEKGVMQQLATPSRMRSPSKVTPAMPGTKALPRSTVGQCTPKRGTLGSPPPRTNSYVPSSSSFGGLATPKSVRGTSVGRAQKPALTPYRGRGNFQSSPGRCRSP